MKRCLAHKTKNQIPLLNHCCVKNLHLQQMLLCFTVKSLDCLHIYLQTKYHSGAPSCELNTFLMPLSAHSTRNKTTSASLPCMGMDDTA